MPPPYGDYGSRHDERRRRLLRAAPPPAERAGIALKGKAEPARLFAVAAR
ncbi:MAG TPA: hypothetical protein VEV43_07965 [Actinomycetota bacterium]|nr:hypothetical protein [Actinomycetota bacterium]